MSDISIILGTARNSYSMIGLPNVHIFKPTLDSLQKQKFDDFELIISDCRFEHRPKCFEGKPFNKDDYKFPIKHILAFYMIFNNLRHIASLVIKNSRNLRTIWENFDVYPINRSV